jgi:uncharacterized protein (DUF169 family)
MEVPAYIMVLANATGWSKGGRIGMNGVMNGIFEKGGDCPSNM